MLELLIK